MAISDDTQRLMPTAADRVYGSQVLAYKEAVLLTHPSNPTFKGEVRIYNIYPGQYVFPQFHRSSALDLFYSLSCTLRI